MNNSTILKALGVSLLAFSSSAFSATLTDNLDISLTVQAACTLDSVTDVNETVAVGFTGAHPASGNVTVTCLVGTPYTVAMGAGLHDSGAQRNVEEAGGVRVPYIINKVGGAGAAWGTAGTIADNSFNGATDQNGTGTGATQVFGYNMDFTLAGTEIAATYTDTVLVTLEF